jgi:perosamine synthetase
VKKIVRGRFSHTLLEDIQNIITCSFSNIQQNETIEVFEKKIAHLVQKEFAVSFAFARTAIYYSLKSLDLPKETQIIMPSITIKGILDVVLDLGFEPIFVDTDLKTGCIDDESLRKILQFRKPRVCLLTYLYGVIPDMEPIISTLKSSNIFIVEDFSQALNASFKDKKIGSFGDISIYSASAVKTLDTYGGGFAITSDRGLANKLRDFQGELKRPPKVWLLKKLLLSFLKNLVTHRAIFSTVVFPLLTFLNRKGNSSFDRFVGDRSKSPLEKLPEEWFYSYTTLQANYGLKRINQLSSSDRKRVEIARLIHSSNNGLKFIKGHNDAISIYWQSIVLPNNVPNFRTHMYKHGIDTAMTSLIEISQLPNYEINSETPKADFLYSNGVYLPCYSQMTKSEIEQLVRALRSYQEV